MFTYLLCCCVQECYCSISGHMAIKHALLQVFSSTVFYTLYNSSNKLFFFTLFFIGRYGDRAGWGIVGHVLMDHMPGKLELVLSMLMPLGIWVSKLHGELCWSQATAKIKSLAQIEQESRSPGLLCVRQLFHGPFKKKKPHLNITIGVFRKVDADSIGRLKQYFI